MVKPEKKRRILTKKAMSSFSSNEGGARPGAQVYHLSHFAPLNLSPFPCLFACPSLHFSVSSTGADIGVGDDGGASLSLSVPVLVWVSFLVSHLLSLPTVCCYSLFPAFFRLGLFVYVGAVWFVGLCSSLYLLFFSRSFLSLH